MQLQCSRRRAPAMICDMWQATTTNCYTALLPTASSTTWAPHLFCNGMVWWSEISRHCILGGAISARNRHLAKSYADYVPPFRYKSLPRSATMSDSENQPIQRKHSCGVVSTSIRKKRKITQTQKQKDISECLSVVILLLPHLLRETKSKLPRRSKKRRPHSRIWRKTSRKPRWARHLHKVSSLDLFNIRDIWPKFCRRQGHWRIWERGRWSRFHQFFPPRSKSVIVPCPSI